MMASNSNCFPFIILGIALNIKKPQDSMNPYCDVRYTLTPRSYIILNISLGLKAFYSVFAFPG